MNWYKTAQKKHIIPPDQFYDAIANAIVFMIDGDWTFTKSRRVPPPNAQLHKDSVRMNMRGKGVKYPNDEYIINIRATEFLGTFSGMDPETGLDAGTGKPILTIDGSVAKIKQGEGDPKQVEYLENAPALFMPSQTKMPRSWWFKDVTTPYEAASVIRQYIERENDGDDDRDDDTRVEPDGPGGMEISPYEEIEKERYKNVPETDENMAWLPGQGREQQRREYPYV